MIQLPSRGKTGKPCRPDWWAALAAPRTVWHEQLTNCTTRCAPFIGLATGRLSRYAWEHTLPPEAQVCCACSWTVDSAVKIKPQPSVNSASGRKLPDNGWRDDGCRCSPGSSALITSPSNRD